MPHCVLSLKLIGLTFDCYDGERARRLGEGVLSKDQRKSFLPDNPSLLEMLSHRFDHSSALHSLSHEEYKCLHPDLLCVSFFLGGYLIGPQIPLKRYRYYLKKGDRKEPSEAKFREFVRPDYTSSLPASPLPYGFKRLGLAFCYMLLQVTTSLKPFSSMSLLHTLYNIIQKYVCVGSLQNRILAGDRINVPSIKLAWQWKFPANLPSPPPPPAPPLGQDCPLQVHLQLASGRVCLRLVRAELCRAEGGRLCWLEGLCQRQSSQVIFLALSLLSFCQDLLWFRCCNYCHLVIANRVQAWDSCVFWQRNWGIQHQHKQLGRSLRLQKTQVFGQQNDLSGPSRNQPLRPTMQYIQVTTLVFLAVWHGFHAGYYVTFFNEFATVTVERQFLSIWGKSPKVRLLWSYLA